MPKHWCAIFTPFPNHSRTPNACVKCGRTKENHSGSTDSADSSTSGSDNPVSSAVRQGQGLVLVDDPQNPHNQVPNFSKRG